MAKSNYGETTSLSPLPPYLHRGLISVSSLGLISFVCSTSLFLYLTYRFISWTLDRRNRRSVYRTNQFLVLIYNLLLADIQQSLAFSLNISAVTHNAINVDMPTCWAQGWFLSTGDLASSVWILAIAIHTFLSVIKDYKIPQLPFYISIVVLWTFIYAMALIGVGLHPHDLYVRAGPWCWINSRYDDLRLWGHYLWVFISMFGIVVIYALMIGTLQFRLHVNKQPFSCPFSRTTAGETTSKSQSENIEPTTSTYHPLTNLNQKTAKRATGYLILYPLIYVVCTIPLAVGRMASMTGVKVSDHYFCIAGAMIASNGWLDVILYGFTRGSLVFGHRDSDGRLVDAGRLESFMWYYGSGPVWRDGAGGDWGTVTIIEGGGNTNSEPGDGERDDDGTVKINDSGRPSGDLNGNHTPRTLARKASSHFSQMTRSKSAANINKKKRRGQTASTEDLYSLNLRGNFQGGDSFSTVVGNSNPNEQNMYMAGGGIKAETTVDVRIGERRGGGYELRDVGGLGGGGDVNGGEKGVGDGS